MLKLAAIVIVANLIVWSIFIYDRSSEQTQNDQQEMLLRSASQSIGMPALVNFSERKMLKRVYEIRDQNLSTTTYIVDMNGHPHKICDSVGYGFSNSTQFTNPDRNSTSNVVLRQAEPNGLFSAPEYEGTWVSCVDPASKQMQIVYIEPRVIISPFPLSVN